MELLQVEQGEQGAEVRAEVRVVRWVLTGIGYTSRPLVLVLVLVYKLHLDAVGDILMEKEVEVSRVGSHDHVGGCGRCEVSFVLTLTPGSSTGRERERPGSSARFLLIFFFYNDGGKQAFLQKKKINGVAFNRFGNIDILKWKFPRNFSRQDHGAVQSTVHSPVVQERQLEDTES